jgi:hypothetical protein
VDFIKKPSIVGSGWPLNYNELFNYYQRANQYFELMDVDFKVAPLSKDGSQEVIHGLSQTGVFKTGYYIEKKDQVNFGEKYKARLKNSSNVRVILNANVTKLNFLGDRISSASIKP